MSQSEVRRRPRKRVVLLVEDDPALGKKLKAALAAVDLAPEAEMIAELAESGALALVFLVGVRPDLVILDLDLHDGDGFDLCQRIKHDWASRQVPILAISGLTPVDEARERAIAAGCVQFLAKPLDLVEFADEVRVLVTRAGRGGSPGR